MLSRRESYGQDPKTALVVSQDGKFELLCDKTDAPFAANWFMSMDSRAYVLDSFGRPRRLDRRILNASPFDKITYANGDALDLRQQNLEHDPACNWWNENYFDLCGIVNSKGEELIIDPEYAHLVPQDEFLKENVGFLGGIWSKRADGHAYIQNENQEIIRLDFVLCAGEKRIERRNGIKLDLRRANLVLYSKGERVIDPSKTSKKDELLIDPEDQALIPESGWQIGKRGHVYVICDLKNVRLDRLITKCEFRSQVIHINKNKLDCRKINLLVINEE